MSSDRLRQGAAIVLVFALSTAILVGIGTVGVSAQSDDIEDANASDPNSVYAEVDSNIRIMSWEFDEETETFEITLSNDGRDRSRVSIMEIIDLDDGSDGPLGMREISMRPGEEAVVEVSATLDSNTAGIIVMTDESIDNGQVQPIIYDSGFGSLFSGASTWGLVRLSALSGALGTFGFAGLFAWHRRAERTDNVETKL